MQHPEEPSRAQVLRYGLPGVALASAALPLYLVTPHLYAGAVGLPLALVGLCLMATRLIDAFTDPIIGRWMDKTPGQRFERWMLPSLALLCLGMVLLLSPPEGWSSAALMVYMTACALVVSLSNSAAGLAHQAWLVSWTPRPESQARLVTSREGFTLVGVMVAAVLASQDSLTGLLGWVLFAALLGGLALRGLPGQPSGSGARPAPVSVWQGFQLLDAPGRGLLGVMGLNALANAIPGTLFLFFVADQLGLAQQTAGVLLMGYFLAAAVSMVFWQRLLRQQPAGRVWQASVLVSIAAFVWATQLGAGDLWPFAIICLVTGFALGAELTCPALLLAAAISRSGQRGQHEALIMGLWTLLQKLALALAAGLVLPLLAGLGYTPGTGHSLALPLAYAALPCGLKLAALLMFRRLETRP
ncbi:MAG: MFS transporter [Burkholderiaceae bacterium]